jgi:hypothetical protein
VIGGDLTLTPAGKFTMQSSEDALNRESEGYYLSLVSQICRNIKNIFSESEKYKIRSSERYVMVDLTVDVPEFIVTKLIIAKYLSWHFNSTLCGISFNPQRLSPVTRSFCEAFGCTRSVNISELAKRASREIPDLSSLAARMVADWPKEGPDLRRRILDTRLDGLPVGDLIYDTHLRQTGKPSIEGVDGALLHHITETAVFTRVAKILFDSEPIDMVVGGHMVYYHFGTFCRMALGYGIPVTQDLSINPFRLRKFSSALTARQFPGQFDPREFDTVFRQERAAAISHGQAYLNRRFAGQAELGFKDGLEGAYGANRRRYTKEELCRSLGWDPAKPIVVLMSHVFFESPHAVDGNLYNDYYEWLEDTLATAARNPQVQWFLKKHPQQKHFDEALRHSPTLVNGETAMERLMAPVRDCPHIALCPDDLHTESLIQSSHAIVTQHGRAGYEFAASGVPVVLAGRAAYARLGFTIEPRTQEDYRQVLGAIQDLPPVTDEQREKALTYIYMFFEKSRVRTTMLPDLSPRGFWAPKLDFAFMEDFLKTLGGYEPLEDPLYHAIRAMMRNDHTCLFDLAP